jgi:hypothetical protein
MVSLFGVLLASGFASAADYSGNYTGDNLAVEIVPDAGAYRGEIRLGEHTFPVKAREAANALSGAFTSQGVDYSFNATLDGDKLTLVTDGTTYTLRRLAPPPVNPLAGIRQSHPQQANGNTAATDGNALAGYTLINHSDFGKAFTRQFAAVDDVKKSLQLTFPDLARYFGARPEILGAYEDQKDHKSAGVAFSAQLDGKPIKGFVSSKVNDQGATVAVIYCQADAPAAEWTKLITPPAAPDAAGNANGNDDPAALKEAIAKVPLKTYAIPDNTGTIGIAEGWTTNAQTLAGTTLNGPADQQVIIGVGAEVITPDNPMIRLNQQLAMNAWRMGGQPHPPINMLIAPYNPDAAEALKNLAPAINQLNQRNGLPTSTLDRIVQQWKVPAMTPKGSAGLVLYDFTKTTRGESRHYRSLLQLEVYVLGPGTWGFYATQLIAPQETFKQDLPVMLAQSLSLRENAAVIQQKTQEQIATQNQRFAAMQAANKEVQDAFDRRNKAWERNQLITSRSNADFDEVIRGYRTVENTPTGDRTSVDLGNVDRIVDNLNRYEPGRYKQIPLRDELYPLPNH